MTRILLLGGTTEASRLAARLADAGIAAVFSYAGRTAAPLAQPLPLRIGGFGGVAGLAAYLRDNAITHVIDATHPFAAQISANAVEACAATGTALIAYERPPWQPGPGDNWHCVANIPAALAALPESGARVFLAIGRQNLDAFAGRPGNHYVLRLVDPPDGPLPLPDAQALIARGPFDIAGDRALMKVHRITHVVAKNAGGSSARAKLIAARDLHLPVILIDRPVIPPRPVAETADQVMDWIADHAPPSARRGE
ncbi:cobalt-precorrin-6A reductase [Paracoccus sp. p3-h83]|uniref:cobalt-precorrin-6A reductase n=1 Tax=Paracoccus sp. p3-h83 TaxID=3342805 RepID=UPI0035B99408